METPHPTPAAETETEAARGRRHFQAHHLPRWKGRTGGRVRDGEARRLSSRPPPACRAASVGPNRRQRHNGPLPSPLRGLTQVGLRAYPHLLALPRAAGHVADEAETVQDATLSEFIEALGSTLDPRTRQRVAAFIR
eukprot:scaffold286747_cov15-Tisochrysis_lutea.AAC.1